MPDGDRRGGRPAAQAQEPFSLGVPLATVHSTLPARDLRPQLHACLPSLLEQQLSTRPDAVAVVGAGQQLSYRELVRSSRQLAAHLTRLGVAADHCVGLFAEPAPDLVVGAWGILFAGAAYLPLSPEYPEDRLRYMIENSGTGVIVTQEPLRERLAAIAPRGTRIVTLDEARESAATTTAGPGGRPVPGSAAPIPGPRPDSLAYVIYTSGSTGKPKGVMIEHRSIVSQLRWLQTCGHLGTEVTILQKTPMSFDAAQWELLAVATGAKVVVGAPGSYRDPEALIATVNQHRVTALQGVPTLLQALLDTERLGSCGSLRRIFSGGEALSQRLARALLTELPDASLVNLYGPTETTINATACLVDPAALGDGAGSVPIGVPVDNTQCFILDEDRAPVDIGTTGELYIGGVQLARGYLNRPDLTEERFVPNPFVPTERLYRTGDLASWNPDGTITCAGRADNQVKLRGYRVELDEIAIAVEEHTWVRRAAAVVTDDQRTGFQQLVACVELNPREAALMDQGNHGGHHQSKASKLQVKAQLSDPGLRPAAALAGRAVLALPGRDGTAAQRAEAFGRKTYRFFDGGPVTRAELTRLLAPQPADGPAREPRDLGLDGLGELLRWFGQFRSAERLLPKYSYASPGALYATQLYLESDGLPGLPAGVHYYHPVAHTLVRIADATDTGGAGGGLRVHFLGRRQAIEPVYRNNIVEVLEFETGHMLGVFAEKLPGYGLAISPVGLLPEVRERLDVAAEDHYLGTFEIHRNDGRTLPDPTELYLQAHPGRIADLPAGHYHYRDGALTPLSDAVVERKHVIAINQSVYDRASFGITAVCTGGPDWLAYIALGAKLHRLQRNGLQLGLMSSGYSSKSGHPLPAARRIDEVLAAHGRATGPSYFFLGGKVSEEQIASEGMNEDAVHVKGPAEIIKDDLAAVLPDYMIPNRVLVLDELPLTANGKVDVKRLAAAEEVRAAGTGAPYVAPAGRHQTWLAQAWGQALKYDEVSAADEFFAAGGNSLIAVALVNRINREFGTRLPLQVVFEAPRLADLAARIEHDSGTPASRLVRLHDGAAPEDAGQPSDVAPVFCWPGLGGYPMNLRLLGQRAALGRPFYGVQAQGINAGEQPYPTVQQMAAADLAEIRRLQPAGPYRLWGYSFGARVAFETAWQLEQLGETVDQLLLICPGNPKVGAAAADRHGRTSDYANPAYLTILYSVFGGAISGPEVEQCLATARDEDGFVRFVHERIPALDEQLIRRITRIVRLTYEFDYNFRELSERRIQAPVTVLKAAGDDYSFIEGATGFAAAPPRVVELAGDHYGVLKQHGVGELVRAIRCAPALRSA
ncbi:amino acid adenylation domain-containing protein [Kitasatospora sp. LaBMicrA B282]|uniref:non-ribosomal peptide synthetase family protein n=1 Tax=Kitasatospora sp. LaBMicrA B282 TaxID=3420949 RepID=UPI003D10AA08